MRGAGEIAGNGAHGDPRCVQCREVKMAWGWGWAVAVDTVLRGLATPFFALLSLFFQHSPRPLSPKQVPTPPDTAHLTL